MEQTLPVNTKVLTPEGFKSVKELKVGDTVLDQYEKEVHILNTCDVSEYCITLKSQGDNITKVAESTTFVMSKAGGGMRGAGVTSAKDLVQYYDKQPPKVRPRWPLIDLKPAPEPELDNNIEIIDPYTLGFLLGDGSFRTKGATTPYTTVDDFITDKLKNKGHTITRWKDQKGQITFNIKYIHKPITELGLKGTCSESKFIPKLPYNFKDRYELLQGMMDADGCVNTDSSIEITLKSEKMIDTIKDWVERLGGTATKKGKKGVCKAYNFEGHYWRLYIRHPDASVLFSLPRKVERTKIKPLRNRILDYELSEDKEDCKSLIVDGNSLVIENYLICKDTYE